MMKINHVRIHNVLLVNIFYFIFCLYLLFKVAMLQLSVLQHSADITELEVRKVIENDRGPVAGHSEDDAQLLKICVVIPPPLVSTKSKVSLLMLDSQHYT